MALITLYTAVPVNRILSIQKYGLVTNDKVSTFEGFNENKYLKGRVFQESTMGYIYASKNLPNAIEWGTIITIQTRYTFLILEYKIDENIIEKDICSPDKNILDVRFKENIEEKNITVIMGELVSYEKGKHELINVERKSLFDICEELEVNCENCDKLFKYKDMTYLTNVLLCKQCEQKVRKLALTENLKENINKFEDKIHQVSHEDIQYVDQIKDEEQNVGKNTNTQVVGEENIEKDKTKEPIVKIEINKYDTIEPKFAKGITIEDIKEKFIQRSLLLKTLRDLETETEEMMVDLELQTYNGEMCMEHIDGLCKNIRLSNIEININGRFMDGKYNISKDIYIYVSGLVCSDYPKHENVTRLMVIKNKYFPISIEYKVELQKLETEMEKYKIINVSKELIQENTGRDSFIGLWNYCNRINKSAYKGHY